MTRSDDLTVAIVGTGREARPCKLMPLSSDSIVTGIPFTAALMSWSIWYGVRGFRRSAEWGWALGDERG